MGGWMGGWVGGWVGRYLLPLLVAAGARVRHEFREGVKEADEVDD